MWRAALLSLLASFLVAVGIAGASSRGVAPPPTATNYQPVWSPDGSGIAYRGWDYFSGEPTSFVGMVDPRIPGSGHKVAPLAYDAPAPGFVFSPDGSLISYESYHVKDYTTTRWLAVASEDGTGERLLLPDATPLLWPNPDTIIFQEAAGVGSVRPDGSGLVRFPGNVRGVPSPDGRRFAYLKCCADRAPLHVVDADGTNDITLEIPSLSQAPSWSADSTRLAYLSADDRLVVADPGKAISIFAVPAAGCRCGVGPWSPDGREILYAGAISRQHRSDLSLYRLSLVTGRTSELAAGWMPSFSPDGRWIAYSATGSCGPAYGARMGIYVARADGTDVHRLTNDCHIVGTAGDDTLRGTPYYDVMLGLAGDDKLYADDGYYSGDTLIGGAGDDFLVGGGWNGKLNGGPGDDRLYGGPGQDILVGGPGHDHIDGGRGRDTIYAAEGQRDWITCGTNGPASGNPERDVVYADRFDVVASDCEIVHRA